MAENTPIEQIVERAIGRALETQFPQLREKLSHQVLEDIRPHLGSLGGGAADLLKAVALIHSGSTQKEILRALLEGTAGYSGRAALFVVKAGAATGWQGRAFESDSIKDFALDVSAAAPAKVLRDRLIAKTNVADMDAKFISQFGAPVDEQILLLPLHLKDKVAALVYADSGTDNRGNIDAPALELLVATASAWLEVASLRKQAAKETTGDTAERAEAPAPAPVAPANYSDPFASATPRHAQAAPPPVEEPIAAVAKTAAPAAAAAAPALDPFAQMSPEDADTHRKAQRFARLLMDEVKLYNQAKVAEGRKNKDLYDRLKEDIEKSRATYNKRYGNTPAASGDYLNQEVIRSLAEDDVTLLGPNFQH